jgi:hypothetical protein
MPAAPYYCWSGYYSGSAGSVTTISIGWHTLGSFDRTTYAALYDNSKAKTIVSSSATVTHGTDAFKDYSVTATTTAQSYYICCSSDYWDGSSGSNLRYNAVSGQLGYYGGSEMSSQSDWDATKTFTLWAVTASPSVYVTYTSGGSTYNLTNSPSSKDFGIVSANTTYYAGGGAYSNPVTDGQCTFTITNSQSNAIKVNIKESNPTGGVGWTLSSSVGSDTIKDTAVVSGVDPASGVVLTTSDQVLIASLAGSATKKWDLKRETGTFTDGAQKTSTITLTGVAP